MLGWFQKKSKIDSLKIRYRDLMRKSFEVSLKDPQKSEKVHRQADKIFQEIKYLSMNTNQ